MKKIIILISMIFAISLAKGQVQKNFDAVFGGNLLDSPVETFYVGGKTYVFGNITSPTTSANNIVSFNGGIDYAMVVYKNDGTILKRKTFGGNKEDRLIRAYYIDSLFYLVGYSFSDNGTNKNSDNSVLSNDGSNLAAPYQEIYIVVIDEDGNIVKETSVNPTDAIYTSTSADSYEQLVNISNNNPTKPFRSIYKLLGVGYSNGQLKFLAAEFNGISGYVKTYWNLDPACTCSNLLTKTDTAGFYAQYDETRTTTYSIDLNFQTLYEESHAGYNSNVPVLDYTINTFATTNVCHSAFYPYGYCPNPINNQSSTQKALSIDEKYLFFSKFTNYNVKYLGNAFHTFYSYSMVDYTGDNVTYNSSDSLYISTIIGTPLKCSTQPPPAPINNTHKPIVSIPKGSKPVDGVFNNNKYYVFTEFVNNATTNYPSNIFYSINNAIVRDNSLAPITTLTNKRDVWITESVPVTITTGTTVNTYYTAIRQKSIRANDDIYINKVSEVFDTNKVYIALATVTGIGYDKTSIQKGGFDYWIVKFNLNTMTKMWDTTFGGTADDIVKSIHFNQGVLVVTGESNSPIGANKTVAGYGGKDFWTLNYCLPPTSDFAPTANILNAADYVQFNNLSRYASEFSWDFGDGSGSYEKDPLHYYNSPGYFSVQLTSSNGNCTATKTKTNLIYVKNYVGIEELTLENGRLIYPNPNNGKFYLSEFVKDITIVNSLGESQEFKRSVNTIELIAKDGVYIVSYVIDGFKYNEKIIVKN